MPAICICTHNPVPETFAIVIEALARQTAPHGTFHVLIVDNASTVPLRTELVDPLLAAGIEARIVREPTPGLSRARLKAIAETDDEWVIFVDDDNELAPDYVENAMRFAMSNPHVGCFGGRLVLPDELQPRSWVTPFLPSLGIRDYGDKVIADVGTDEWGEWEPVGAGAVVHRLVLEEYVRRSEVASDFYDLGRTGSWGLASCDDSLMMRGALRVGLGSAYVPNLSLRHHLSPRRFRFTYLMRLMYGYGQSFVRLDRALHGEVPVPSEYSTLQRIRQQIKWRWLQYAAFPWQMRVGQIISDLGRFAEFRRTAQQGRLGRRWKSKESVDKRNGSVMI